MRTAIIAACALAAASVALVQMTDSADARSRARKGMSVKQGGMGMNNTGGRNASPSAAGGNAAQPSRPGTQGSGGGSGGSPN